ncbi:MAG: potassium channel family protein [Gemmataceae bacterium]
MRWLFAHRFQSFLITICALVLAYPLLRGSAVGAVTFAVLRTLVFASALLVLTKDLRWRIPALALGAATLVSQWVVICHDATPALEITHHALAALLLVLAVAVTLIDIFGPKSVSRESIFAALASYVLVALVFAHLYCVVEIAAPRSFATPPALEGALEEPDRRFFILAYFSLVTLTTLGYGDVTPGIDTVRSLAMVEAVSGQFYMAVLIAGLVSRVATPPRLE